MHFTNVIFNLLDNAVKYRREDTPLQLLVTTRDVDNGKLEITVCDNGIGIKKKILKKYSSAFIEFTPAMSTTLRDLVSDLHM